MYFLLRVNIHRQTYAIQQWSMNRYTHETNVCFHRYGVQRRKQNAETGICRYLQLCNSNSRILISSYLNDSYITLLLFYCSYENIMYINVNILILKNTFEYFQL